MGLSRPGGATSRTRQTTSICCFPSISRVIGGAREGKGVPLTPARDHTPVGTKSICALPDHHLTVGYYASIYPSTIHLLSFHPLIHSSPCIYLSNHHSFPSSFHSCIYLSIFSSIIHLSYVSSLYLPSLCLSIHPSFHHLAIISEPFCDRYWGYNIS